MAKKTESTRKTYEFEIKVTVEEYYYVEAPHSLAAFMADLEDPAKVIVKRKTIKKIKRPQNIHP